MRTLIPHFSIPVPKISVSDLAGHIKDHDTYMGTKVVRRVKLVEGLLASRIPNICNHAWEKLVEKMSYLPTLYVLWFMV